MITPSFSPTATERVLPKLALDFTTASLDPRVTFTRTTDATHPATYTNSSGYVVSATNNQPRFDYNPNTLVCNGLLIEESRSNLLQYSQSFSTSPWGVGGSTAVGNSAISPDGTNNTFFIKEDSSNGFHGIYQTGFLTYSPNTLVTTSVYVGKYGLTNSRQWCAITLMLGNTTAATNRYVINVDLNTGLVTDSKTGNFTSTSYSITSVGNYWRIALTAASNSGGTTNYLIVSASNSATPTYTATNDVTYQGDGTSGIYAWGAQFELGAFATSYIPTTSAALTRNADVATMTGTNFSSWWNPTQYSFVISIDTNGKSGDPRIISGGGTAQDVVGINISSGVAYAESYDGGLVKSATGFSTSGSGKVAVAWASNVGYASTSGGAVASAAQTTGFGALTGIYLGSQDGGAQYLNGHIKTIYYYKQKLTNAELQAFSK